jgi:hypothetical protein
MHLETYFAWSGRQMILLIISLGVVHGVLLLPVLLTLLGPGGVFARSTQHKE